MRNLGEGGILEEVQQRGLIHGLGIIITLDSIDPLLVELLRNFSGFYTFCDNLHAHAVGKVGDGLHKAFGSFCGRGEANQAGIQFDKLERELEHTVKV